MFSIEHSLLLVIDVQGKLAYLMQGKEKLFKNIQLLIQGAKILNIPILYTEQAPDKIGSTIPEISKYLTDLKPAIKKSFSCCGQKTFLEELNVFKRRQIMVCGIETHVCVLQTVFDLLNLKYQIQVIADAVSSRSLENKYFALERMKLQGATLTTTEMITCELLKGAEHLKFKEIMALIK